MIAGVLFSLHMKLLTAALAMMADVLWKTKFVASEVHQRWLPIVTDAPKTFVFINRNSSAMVADEIANDWR